MDIPIINDGVGTIGLWLTRKKPRSTGGEEKATRAVRNREMSHWSRRTAVTSKHEERHRVSRRDHHLDERYGSKFLCNMNVVSLEHSFIARRNR